MSGLFEDLPECTCRPDDPIDHGPGCQRGQEIERRTAGMSIEQRRAAAGGLSYEDVVRADGPALYAPMGNGDVAEADHNSLDDDNNGYHVEAEPELEPWER